MTILRRRIVPVMLLAVVASAGCTRTIYDHEVIHASHGVGEITDFEVYAHPSSSFAGHFDPDVMSAERPTLLFSRTERHALDPRSTRLTTARGGSSTLWIALPSSATAGDRLVPGETADVWRVVSGASMISDVVSSVGPNARIRGEVTVTARDGDAITLDLSLVVEPRFGADPIRVVGRHAFPSEPVIVESWESSW